MKRHFALPVVIVISAHAFLLFGFTKKPAVIREKTVTPSARPFDAILMPPIEDSDPPPANPFAGAAAAGKTPPLPPVAPEPVSTRIAIDDFIVPIERGWTRHAVEVATNIIPTGPSHEGGAGEYWENGYGGGPIHGVLSLDYEPRARARPAPAYPFSLKSSGITGEVLVEFVVDETGRVIHPRVVRSSHSAFEGPTLNAVSRWRFEPGTRRNKPVRFKMVVPVKFNLND